MDSVNIFSDSDKIAKDRPKHTDEKWWLDIDLRQLAESLGIERAGQKHKWACPKCGSRDNLHIYPPPRGAFCFGCGGIDAVGLVMEAKRCSFKAALEFLGKPASIDEPKRKRKCKEEKNHMNAYTWIWQNADPLSEEHQEWFRSRGLRPEYDCKTVSPVWWREICDTASAKEIGILNKNNKPHPWWTKPFILVPYFARDKVELIRFRRTHEEDGPKMLSLSGSSQALRPFGAERVEGVRNSTNFPDSGGLGDDPYPDDEMPETRANPLFIVEGEWDAYAVQQAGHDCVATPGATVWPDAWTRWVERVTKTKTEFGSVQRPVFIVGDGDEAGVKMANRVGKKLAHLNAHAYTWDDGDACDAIKSGTLQKQIQDILCQPR
jgi:hypothetical protein